LGLSALSLPIGPGSGLSFAAPMPRRMSRDPRKLRVFLFADALVLEVYRATTRFPIDERFGLQAQLRRAAVSAATNIGEGCARRTTREYVHFLNIANGSAAEARYLLEVAHRLEMIPREVHSRMALRYTELLKGLQKLIATLDECP
jgi:four helix bundle protein